MKKLSMIMIIVLYVCAIAIIPLNIFVLNMPKFISIIVSMLIAVMTVLFILNGKGRKKITKCVVSLFSVLVICISLFCTYCNPYWNSINFKKNTGDSVYKYDHALTKEEAKKDLDYAMASLKLIHPMLKDGVPDDIQKRYEEVSKNIENDRKIDVRMLDELIESIFSRLNDGHTCVASLNDNEHYLKDRYSREHNGYKLVEVNGVNIEKLFNQNKMLYSYFDENWGMHLLKNDLGKLEGLNFLRIPTDHDITYTYEDKNGGRDTVVYHKDDFITSDQYNKLNNISSNKDFVHYEIDKEHSLAVLTLTNCTYNDKYRNCVKEMFTKVKEQGIKNVAVDLRGNGGGSSLVADEFIKYLNVDRYNEGTSSMRLGFLNIPFNNNDIKNKKNDDLLFHGNVYALTSDGTFSSAMDFAQYIKDNKLGKIVGQAPANNPNGYGEVAEFFLPNSKLYMQISTTKYNRVDKSCTDKLVEPDIDCDSNDALKVLYEKL